MAFPTNPTDGQQYFSAAGTLYTYKASGDRWDVEAGSIASVTGIQGETGAGVQGETGLQGSQGIQGETGVQGETGSGIQGETGLQGETGVEGTGAYVWSYVAGQFLNPNNSDWTVNALAPAAADSNNNAIDVRKFDDTTEEGVGFMFSIPSGITSLTFYFKSRAETAPASTQAVIPSLYTRTLDDNASVSAWSSGTDFTALSFPTNENWQYDSQTITLSTLSLTAGDLIQFELTRDTGSGSDTLSGDWTLAELRIEGS